MRERSSITALLGPTNTGKTHRAIERMLDFPTGMIGLPLRLLAREIFDRLTARVGEERVALVTGEEKRVPKRASYWVCTVEAMPLDLDVDFLAVDEIQLAAHPQRGHVFTQRLLGARGTQETWFLGSDTMREIVSELVPHATITGHPRLSRLSHAGTMRLPKLPPRSAAVAFSTEHVHDLAERVKRAFGGVAVVLGALSPRTRNAQVAMFQAGEVDHLVATDAIGMGLNLAVDHVAFASLRKFDGREQRDLDASEVAQIAGRAGRYHNDGTFGAISPLQIPEGLAAAIELHRFPSVRRLIWRNDDLDFTSIDALIHSLKRPPPSRLLRLIDDPEDTAALVALAMRSEVRANAQDEEGVRLLWEVCTVPDFRKLLFEAHAGLLAELFVQLTSPQRVIDETWLAEQVDYCDDVRGDVETLLGRIASIRTWTYVTNRSEWLEHASEWQARTRDVEDRLSDALHDALVQRFVDPARPRRAHVASARARTGARETTDEYLAATAIPPAKGHPFAALAAMRNAMAPEVPRVSQGASATRRAWVESLVDAHSDRFDIDARGRIAFDDAEVGQLVRGTRLVLPDVKLAEIDGLGGGAQARVLRRLVAFARDWITQLLAPLRDIDPRSLSPDGQRVVYVLDQALGTVRIATLQGHHDAATASDHAILARAGVVFGHDLAYVEPLLTPQALTARAIVVDAWFGRARELRTMVTSPAFALGGRNPGDERLLAMGYAMAAGFAVRADHYETLRALAHELGLDGITPALLATHLDLAVDDEVARRIARAIAPDAPRDTSSGDGAMRARVLQALSTHEDWWAVRELLRVLASPGPPISRARLQRIVAHELTDGSRLEFDEDHTHLRLVAAQADAPARLYTPVPRDRVESSLQNGLQRTRRHAIAMFASSTEARAAGADDAVVLEVDAAAMRSDGVLIRHEPDGVFRAARVDARHLRRPR